MIRNDKWRSNVCNIYCVLLISGRSNLFSIEDSGMDGEVMTREEALQILDTIPTIGEQVDALEMAIKALVQEPCEDCISRQEVIKITDGVNDLPSQKLDKILSLPSIQPKPKTGHWIISPNDCFVSCSECGLHGDKGIYKHYRWCPNCGAKMESEVPT